MFKSFAILSVALLSALALAHGLPSSVSFEAAENQQQTKQSSKQVSDTLVFDGADRFQRRSPFNQGQLRSPRRGNRFNSYNRNQNSEFQQSQQDLRVSRGQVNQQLLPFDNFLDQVGGVASGYAQSAHQSFNGLSGAFMSALGAPQGSLSEGHFGLAGLLRRIYRSIELLRNELETLIYEEFGISRPVKTIDLSETEKKTKIEETTTERQEEFVRAEDSGSRSLSRPNKFINNKPTRNTFEAEQFEESSVDEKFETTEKAVIRDDRPYRGVEAPQLFRLQHILRDVESFLGLLAKFIVNLDFRQALNPINSANLLLGSSIPQPN